MQELSGAEDGHWVLGLSKSEISKIYRKRRKESPATLGFQA